MNREGKEWLWRTLAWARLILVPGGLLLGLVVVVFTTPLARVFGWTTAVAALADITPAALFLIALVLALWFHQQRLSVVLCLFLVIDPRVWMLMLGAAGSGDAGRVCALLVLASGLLWIGFLPIRRPFSLAALWPFAMLAGSVALLVWALLGVPATRLGWRERLGLDVLAQRLVTGWLEPSWLSLWIVAGISAWALAFYLHRLVTERSRIDRGILWTAVASALAVASPPESGLPSPYGVAAGALALISVFETFRQLAYDDELTGLPGRRALDVALGGLRGRYVIVMVDVDHFKQFNDSYGHEAGDQVLRLVAAKLREVGGGGRAYRYGGEEFCVLFPRSSVRRASKHVDDLLHDVEQTSFQLRGPDRPKKAPKKRRAKRKGGRRRATPATRGVRSVNVTISAGMAQPNARHSTPKTVLEAADAALYKAKAAGRNRFKTA